MSLDQDKALYMRWKNAYYNGDPEVEDHVFDALEDKIKRAEPTWRGLKETGVRTLDKKAEVPLPQLMPSLNKVYPEDVEKTFAKKKTLRWLELIKYDGTSLLLRYVGGKPTFLGTRGDGELGKDITFLIPFLRIPEVINVEGTVDLRIEGMLSIKDFQDHFSVDARGEKEGKKNARAAVNGIFNRSAKEASRTQADFNHVHMKVLGVYGKPIEEGLKWARYHGFDPATYRAVTKATIEADPTVPSSNLRGRIANSEFEMDGLVYIPHDRVFGYDSTDKPKWTFAFKENTAAEDAPETRVVDIIYEEAKSKKLTPVAIVEPTEIGGVTVTQVTMSNVALMEQRRVGPGALIKIVRSGDVIPLYVSTVEPAKLKWPEVPYRREGCWLYATEFSEAAEHQKILHFFTTCGIENIAIKSIEALYSVGFKDIMSYIMIPKLMGGPKRGWVQREILKSGIGPAKTETLIKELAKIKKVDLKTFILATACMPAGMGDTKLTDIQSHYTLQNMLQCSDTVIRDRLIGHVPGFKETSAQKVVEGFKNFRPIYEEAKNHIEIVPDTLVIEEAPKEGPFTGMSALWTGYRSPEQEKIWTDGGGEVASSVSSKTTYVFWKVGGKKSTKVEKAGSRAIHWEDFIKRI